MAVNLSEVQGILKELFLLCKTEVAYRVWKRKIRKYGNFCTHSSFKLLEVGCGLGYFLHHAEKWFPQSELLGLDIHEMALNYAAKHLNRAKLTRHDAHTLPFDHNTFDLLVALHLIEHLREPEKFFSEAKRVLKPEGLLIIATPNPAGIPARLLRDKWHSFHTEHISLRAPNQWGEVIKESGFQILEDGTTGLSGFAVLRKLPLAIINWIPLSIFGYFPWYKGESYMAIAKKK